MTELRMETFDGSVADRAVGKPRCISGERVDRAVLRSGGGCGLDYLVVTRARHGFWRSRLSITNERKCEKLARDVQFDV